MTRGSHHLGTAQPSSAPLSLCPLNQGGSCALGWTLSWSPFPFIFTWVSQYSIPRASLVPAPTLSALGHQNSFLPGLIMFLLVPFPPTPHKR